MFSLIQSVNDKTVLLFLKFLMRYHLHIDVLLYQL